MSAATTRSRTPDRLCAEAVDLAREAAAEAAAPGLVGEHVGVASEGDRVVTHFFECREAGYRGWRWAVTVARASRAKFVTLDETVLLPGTDALLAPEWVPWSERLRPGDLGPGDLLPTDADDLRLEPGWTGEDEPPPNSALERSAAAVAGSAAGADVPVAVYLAGQLSRDEPSGSAEVTGEQAAVADVEDAEVTPGPATALPTSHPGGPLAEGKAVAAVRRGAVTDVVAELGMGRARVLSRYGLHTAADRWDEDFGARTPMAQSAPASCQSCGFLVPIAGSLRQAFGVCANEFSPADGRVVSLAYGCGGHSEAAVMPAPQRPAPPVVDETKVDPMPLRPAADSGSVDTAGPAEEFGHS